MPTRSTGRPQRLPGLVWLITVVHLLLLLLYSVLVPVLRAPDEPQHLDMLLVIEEGQRWPGLYDRAVDGRVFGAMDAAGLDFDDRRKEPADTAAAAVPRAERPSFGALPPEPGWQWWNQQWQHPPLAYAVAVAGTHLLSGGDHPVHDVTFDRYIWLARVVSVLLIAPLPLLVAASLQRLGVNHAVTVAGAAVPLAIPQLTHIGSTISNDNLLTAAVAIVTWLLVRVLTGDRTWRTAVAIGVVTAVAVLAKGFGLFLALWVPLGYLWAAVSRRDAGALWRGVAAGVVALGLGGWWYVRNVVVHGALQPSGVPRPPAVPDGFVPDLTYWAQFAAEHVPVRFWGSFGWYQVSLPYRLVVAATAVLAVGVLLALVRPVRPARRSHILFLLVPLVAIGGIVLFGAWGYYRDFGMPLALQGRYLFPAVPALAVVVALGYGGIGSRDHGLAARWLPLLSVAFALVLQVVAVSVLARRFWGDGDGGGALAALLAWAPIRPAATAGLLVACATSALVLLVASARPVVTPAAPVAPRRGPGHAADQAMIRT